MTRDMIAYWLSIADVGSAGAEQLLRMFGSYEEIYRRKPSEWKKTPHITDRIADILDKERKEGNVERSFEALIKKGIHFTYTDRSDYPEKLKNISNKPFGLFYIGSLPDPQKKSVAVVGARRADHEGLEFARLLSRQMSENGIEIISGMAYGIDSASHTGALSVAGARTYCVLGCGPDVCYPERSRAIYERVKTEGGIISEFPPGTMPLKNHFPRRNRIISGLSDGVLVIEAGQNSGSLITANQALDQGKSLFVIPGDIMNPLFSGSNELIKTGAFPVTGIRDILDGLGIFLDQNISSIKRVVYNNLEREEKIVYASLGLEPAHLSRIIHMSGLPLQEVMKALVSLEIRGAVTCTSGQYYAVNISGVKSLR
ncbi:MAG: DNA-processing protein DprA [Lachnospiraceae bacterium]|jgi:DNA processing protein|nr:DNA-processing protein DprA [Lachnospiraceae bacterium]MEE3460462.1 DNA-processing protein DprA [Lachnospiraceae bacterium]